MPLGEGRKSFIDNPELLRLLIINCLFPVILSNHWASNDLKSQSPYIQAFYEAIFINSKEYLKLYWGPANHNIFFFFKGELTFVYALLTNAASSGDSVLSLRII